MNYKYLTLLILVLGCGLSQKDFLLKSLTEIGYQKGRIEDFKYRNTLKPDSIARIETQYYVSQFVEKYKEKKSFLEMPSIKDSTRIWVGFPGINFRKNKYSCIDTIDVYIDNKLASSGLCPYKLSCRADYPDLPLNMAFTYVNKNKQKEAKISIVFRNDKIYYDTIVPLRFKEISIWNDADKFSFYFEKALD
jgi:hypothetical protein